MAEVNQARVDVSNFIHLMDRWRYEMSKADDKGEPCHWEVTVDYLDEERLNLLKDMAIAVLPLASSVNVSLNFVCGRQGGYGRWCTLRADYNPAD